MERTSSYVANEDKYLKQYGASIAYDGDTLKTTSTKYTMVYQHNSSKDNTSISNSEANLNTASQANYEKNNAIYGDAHRETSTAGTGSSSWYGDYSYFIGLTYPFFIRGGYWGNTTVAGLFAFNRRGGNNIYYVGFRVVLVSE